MFSLCRLCAKHTNASDLTTEVCDITSKLKVCCGWKPIENDAEMMPNKACNLCVENLQQSWNFAESIWAAQQQLIKLASEVHPQTDIDPMSYVEGIIDDSIKHEPDNRSETDEDHQQFDTELFVEPIIKSDFDSTHAKKTIRRSKKSAKKVEEKASSTCDSFMAAVYDEDQLADGTIRASAVARLEKLFPEMKTIIWNECKYICKKCDQIIKSPQNFFAHNRSFHLEETPTMDFFCFYCNSKHRREHFLSRHMAVEHFPHLKYRCYYCPDYFWDPREQMKHQNMHTDVEYKCEVCELVCCNRDILYAHVSQIHLKKKYTDPDAKYTCELCNKDFVTKWGIKTHMLQHTKKFDYVCDQCGWKFKTKGNLKGHMETTHTDEKPFACKQCERRFKTKHQLKSHDEMHSGLKKVECTVCHKRVRKQYDLTVHMRSHNNTYPYSCKYCEKKFRHTSSLRTHERAHKNDKPYACGQCAYRSTNWPNLNKHSMRIHSIDLRIKKGNLLATETMATTQLSTKRQFHILNVKCCKQICQYFFRFAKYDTEILKYCEREKMLSLCRLCANRIDDLEATADISELCPKLMFCCGWRLSENEWQMPQKACRLCVDELQRSWNFSERIRLAAEKLHILSRQSIGNEPVVQIKEVVKEEIECSPEFENLQASAFNPPSIRSNCESLQKNFKKREKVFKKTAEKTNTNPDSFLALLTVNDRLADGKISETGVAKLETEFPDMTMTWNDCQYICKKCDKTFKSPQNFFAHNRSVHVEELLSNEICCFYCNAKHKREYLLDRHIADDHFPHLKFKCFYCTAYFWDVQKLIKHRSTHKDVQYKCEICQHILYSRDLLYTHVSQTHLKKNWGEFICDICSKTFATKDRIKSHMINHSGKCDYVCDKCGSTFRQKCNLKHHVESMHNVEKSVACNQCDKKFTTKRHLKIHLKYHGDDKPLKCTICDSRFRTKQALKYHIIVHTNNFPFECTFCDKKFKHRIVKKVHERTHTNEKPYACSQCDYKSANIGNLNKHSLRIHSIDLRTKKDGKPNSN
ncbi:zinc finger protein 425-like [Contarinia nasturtii]|uniref:zinc finger protein 425-like n=1 Tax=Contarinia nasturtii TaxID=265458 RepID=UPI0012D4AFC4|nr:zinc finger protein 425-like [Contarinia nasturtii]